MSRPHHMSRRCHIPITSVSRSITTVSRPYCVRVTSLLHRCHVHIASVSQLHRYHVLLRPYHIPVASVSRPCVTSLLRPCHVLITSLPDPRHALARPSHVHGRSESRAEKRARRARENKSKNIPILHRKCKRRDRIGPKRAKTARGKCPPKGAKPKRAKDARQKS